MKWFRRAADAGDAYAQYRVGSMYARGRGAVQDYCEAFFWLTLAASNDPGLFLEDYVKHRDEVASHLLPDEIAAARRLAQQWKPTPQA